MDFVILSERHRLRPLVPDIPKTLLDPMTALSTLDPIDVFDEIKECFDDTEQWERNWTTKLPDLESINNCSPQLVYKLCAAMAQDDVSYVENFLQQGGDMEAYIMIPGKINEHLFG